MEKFKLVTNYNAPAGIIAIIEDDFDAALLKAIERAKRKVDVLTDVNIFHVTEDKWSTNETLVMTVKGKR